MTAACACSAYTKQIHLNRQIPPQSVIFVEFVQKPKLPNTHDSAIDYEQTRATYEFARWRHRLTTGAKRKWKLHAQGLSRGLQLFNSCVFTM